MTISPSLFPSLSLPPLPSASFSLSTPPLFAPPEETPNPEPQPLSLLHGPVDPPLLDLTLSEVLELQCKHFPTTREFLVFSHTGARWSFSDLDREASLLARGLLVYPPWVENRRGGADGNFDGIEIGGRRESGSWNVGGNGNLRGSGGNSWNDKGRGRETGKHTGIYIRPGDRVGIMAGNCEQYVSLLFAVARVGGILVILNNTYTAEEAVYGLRFTECKLLFTTRRIGRLDNQPLLDTLAASSEGPEVILLNGPAVTTTAEGKQVKYRTYNDLVAAGGDERRKVDLASIERKVLSHQVCNLQFTSGTTGHPKAAMLTHHNLINNARFIAARMNLSPADTLCCPPPLFHCFGLVLGLLACLVSGAKIVYPAETFDPHATLSAIVSESCTALHGVPTMIDSLLSLSLSHSVSFPSPPTGSNQPSPSSQPAPLSPTIKLRTGIIAGAPVPRPLVEKLISQWHMTEFTSSYGLTEASPTVFNASFDDPLPPRLETVGTLMPHAKAKIVDPVDGTTILPLGERGELCVSGYQVQAGYWNNSAKTAEIMRPDAEGTVWLHTGDEAVFDAHGRCRITGRLKDIVIKGGENVYPAEIEERLLRHPLVGRAIVVGVKDRRYGEVVGAFLEKNVRGDGNSKRIGDGEVREWVRRRLGRHKAPSHIFWLGEEGVPRDVPLTGSGKVKKFEMAKLAEKILEARGVAKL